jgi:hypothetical protein
MFWLDDPVVEAGTKPEPFSTSKTSNWVARKGGLPVYIQHVAHDIMEKGGKTESAAIAIAISAAKKNAAKGNKQAAAAVAQWEKMKATEGLSEEGMLAVFWLDEGYVPAPTGPGAVGGPPEASGEGEARRRRREAAMGRADSGTVGDVDLPDQQPVGEMYDEGGLPRDALSRAADKVSGRGSMVIGGGIGVEKLTTGGKDRFRVIGGATHDGPLSAVTQAFTLAGRKQVAGTPGGKTRINDPAVAARLHELDSLIADNTRTIERLTRQALRRKALPVNPGSRWDGPTSVDDESWEQRRIAELNGEIASYRRERELLVSGKVQEAVRLQGNTAVKGDADYKSPLPKPGHGLPRAPKPKAPPKPRAAGGNFNAQHPRGTGAVGGQFIRKQGGAAPSAQETSAVRRGLGAAITAETVKAFQKKHGLTVDGIVGEQTSLALKGQYHTARATSPGALTDRTSRALVARHGTAGTARGSRTVRRPAVRRSGGGFVVRAGEEVGSDEGIWAVEGDFDPLQHPRALDGKFAEKGAGASSPNHAGVKLSGIKAAGGSNGAKIGSDAQGRRWLSKAYGGDADRVATELVSNAVYRVMGADAATAGRGEFNGKPTVTYPLIDAHPEHLTFHKNGPSKEFGRHFMTDALLANWDVAGLEDDNVLWTPDGRSVRVDQGGTLEFRAQGQKKEFGPVPREVWSMLAPGAQGRRSSHVTVSGLKQQARDIGKQLNDKKIDALIDAAPFADAEMRERVRKNLKARVAWMRRFAAGKETVHFPLDLAQEAAEQPLGPSDAGFWLEGLEEALVTHADWIESLHPRDEHGKFIKKLSEIKVGEKVLLDSKTSITKDKDGTWRVTRSGAIVKGFRTPDDAARAALDKSVKSTDADSVGGVVSHKDFNNYLQQKGAVAVHGTFSHEGHGAFFFGGKTITGKMDAETELGSLRARIKLAQASPDKYVQKTIPTLKAREAELAKKVKAAGYDDKVGSSFLSGAPGAGTATVTPEVLGHVPASYSAQPPASPSALAAQIPSVGTEHTGPDVDKLPVGTVVKVKQNSTGQYTNPTTFTNLGGGDWAKNGDKSAISHLGQGAYTVKVQAAGTSNAVGDLSQTLDSASFGQNIHHVNGTAHKFVGGNGVTQYQVKLGQEFGSTETYQTAHEAAMALAAGKHSEKVPLVQTKVSKMKALIDDVKANQGKWVSHPGGKMMQLPGSQGFQYTLKGEPGAHTSDFASKAAKALIDHAEKDSGASHGLSVGDHFKTSNGSVYTVTGVSPQGSISYSKLIGTEGVQTGNGGAVEVSNALKNGVWTKVSPMPPFPGKKFGKNEKQPNLTKVIAGQTVLYPLKELDLAPGDKVQFKKGGHIYEFQGQAGSSMKFTGPGGGHKMWGGYSKPAHVIKADQSELKLKPEGAVTPSAPGWGSVAAATAAPKPSSVSLTHEQVAAKLVTGVGTPTIGSLPEGTVIQSPDGKIGVLKPSEAAYGGYVTAYDIKTGQKFEAPGSKAPYKVSQLPEVKKAAADLLAKKQAGTTVTTAVGVGSAPASTVGPPSAFQGVASWHQATPHIPTADHLSSAIKSSITKYTGSSYHEINAALRDSSGVKDIEVAKHAANIKKAFQQTGPVTQDVWIGRKTNNDQWKKAAVAGKVIQDNGAISTSVDPNVWSGNIHLNILIRKGSQGAVHINNISHHKNSEYEVLLAPGSMFHVLKREEKGGTTVLYVEML